MKAERALWLTLVLGLLALVAGVLLDADDHFRMDRAYFRAVDRAAAGIASDLTLAEYYRRLIAEFERIPE